MKVTMKDIAERTGVSVNTVSLALRDISSVKKETRELIRQTAAEMGYVFQKTKNEVRNIGLISTGERLQDSYFYMSFLSDDSCRSPRSRIFHDDFQRRHLRRAAGDAAGSV